MQLDLLDSTNKLIAHINSDTMGEFRFTGLPNGKYHIKNILYKLDTAFAIQNQSIKPFLIELNICDINSEQALIDIKKGVLKLLLIGGIAPTYVWGQEKYEKKYGFSYYDYGCQPPDRKCVVAYNQTIFKYLDKKYGRQWREEVRKDIIGYN